MTSVGIVGAGAVGHAVASSLVVARFVRHVLVVSRTAERAGSCAEDVADMAAVVGHPVAMYRVEAVDELRRCDAVVVCLRASTLAEADSSAPLVARWADTEAVIRVGRALRGYRGVILVVTEPVDLMARLLAECSGCRVYGVGAGLDVVRYRSLLAAAYQVPVARVEGSVLGAHDDGVVCVLSRTLINGTPLSLTDPRTEAALATFGARSAATAPSTAGAAGAVLSVLRAALGVVNERIEYLSVRYGEHGCWLGQPVWFRDGNGRVELPSLSRVEQDQLDATDHRLRAEYDTMQLR